jgi:hypothetical protein
MNNTFGVKAHFPLCEFTAWQEPHDGPVGGGSRQSGVRKVIRDAERLPFYICVPLILLISIEGYVGAYELLSAFWRYLSP